MKAILREFLRRYWWVFMVGILWTVLVVSEPSFKAQNNIALAAQSFCYLSVLLVRRWILTPAVLVLPISTRRVALSVWLLIVVLIPLFGAILSFLAFVWSLCRAQLSGEILIRSVSGAALAALAGFSLAGILFSLFVPQFRDFKRDRNNWGLIGFLSIMALVTFPIIWLKGLLPSFPFSENPWRRAFLLAGTISAVLSCPALWSYRDGPEKKPRREPSRGKLPVSVDETQPVLVSHSRPLLHMALKGMLIVFFGVLAAFLASNMVSYIKSHGLSGALRPCDFIQYLSARISDSDVTFDFMAFAFLMFAFYYASNYLFLFRPVRTLPISPFQVSVWLYGSLVLQILAIPLPFLLFLAAVPSGTAMSPIALFLAVSCIVLIYFGAAICTRPALRIFIVTTFLSFLVALWTLSSIGSVPEVLTPAVWVSIGIVFFLLGYRWTYLGVARGGPIYRMKPRTPGGE